MPRVVGALTVLIAAIVMLLTFAPVPALANGIDLPSRRARQGDTISVTGHAWLTCCPPNTPVEHVRLFLVQGLELEEAQRVLLFDVAANERGVISTEFMVPYVTPGRYRLEACGGIEPESAPCLPEGRFTVLSGPSPTSAPRPDAGGDRSGWWPAALVLVGTAGAAAVAFTVKRRRPTER